MKKEELKKRINEDVRMQGNEGAIALAPILDEIVDKMPDDDGNKTDFVLHANLKTREDNDRLYYDFIEQNEYINTILASAELDITKISISVIWNGALIKITQLVYSNNRLEGLAQDQAYSYSIKLADIKDTTSTFVVFFENTSIAYSSRAVIDLGKAYICKNYDGRFRRFIFKYTDITELELGLEEMPFTLFEYAKVSNNGDFSQFYMNSQARMIVPKILSNASDNVFRQSFRAAKAEVIDFKNHVYVKNLMQAFATCKNLKYIIGTIELDSDAELEQAFQGCSNLLYFNMSGLNKDLYIGDSPKLLPETMQYLIDSSSQPTKSESFTITVHNDVLGKINNDNNWLSVKNSLTKKTYIKIISK